MDMFSVDYGGIYNLLKRIMQQSKLDVRKPNPSWEDTGVQLSEIEHGSSECRVQ